MTGSTEILAELNPLEDIARVDLGDKRRNKRVAQNVEALLHQPDRSMPQVWADEAAYEGYCRLNPNPHVEDEALFLPHFTATAERAEKLEHVLCHHDTTGFSFAVYDGEIRRDLAHPSTNQQGFLWHASLMTSADGLRAPVGLVARRRPLCIKMTCRMLRAKPSGRRVRGCTTTRSGGGTTALRSPRGA